MTMKSLTHIQSDTVITTDSLGLNQLMSAMPERCRQRLDELERLPDSNGADYEFRLSDDLVAYYRQIDWDSIT